MENSKLELIGEVISAPTPIRGEKHRSSNNFEINPSKSCIGIKWILPDNIYFRLRRDIKRNGDTTEFQSIWNGMVTDYFLDSSRYYIADPVGALGSFKVKAYAVRNYSGETLIGKMVSSPQKLPGQKHRSSNNFSIIPPSPLLYNGIRWEGPKGVSFSVKTDESMSSDPTVFKDIGFKTITKLESRLNFYIADPKNASSNFVVKAFSIRK